MKINWRICLWYLPLVTFFTLTATKGKVSAQIIPDNTLGSENSLVKTVNPQFERIDGGAIRGINLFHSFREFNIGEGNSAYFANPAAIQNIFTRVTGNNPSQLFGKLGVLGNANLYFFNPNGIIFGRNASLDIRGSFVASTAPSLIFPDNKKFSATNPEAPPLLTNNVSVPVGLQFEGMSGTITNAANLKAGQDLQLAAGNLNLENQVHAGKDLTLQATDTVKIRDSSDNPMIVTAQDKLLVEGNQIDIFALNNSHSGLFSGGDMVLRSVNQVGGDAHFAAGVNFRIEKLDGSLGDLFSPKDPVIFAAGDVSLGDYFGASLHILAGGSVTLGNVDIFFADSADNTINPNNNTLFNHSDRVADLADVTLSDGMELTIDGSIKPTLDVRAGINWSTFAGGVPGNINTGFVFPSFNDTATSADINVGNINIFLPFTDGRKVFLSNQYRPNTSLSGNITVNGGIDTTDFADGGAITLDSRGDISLGGNIDASSFGNFGNGGDITLLAGGNIQTSSQIFSNGLSAGNVTLTSAKDVLITNGAEINVRGGGSGNIAINADNLEISGGTKLRAGIGEAQGFPITKAGNIEINVVGKTIVSDEETIIGNNLGFFDSVGNSGDININTGSLEVKNGAFLIGNIFGEGDSGTINITAQNSVKFDGSGIQNGVLGIGNSGGINITTGSFAAINGSRFQADTLGTGNAGKVNITARDSIITDDFAIFTRAESGATGNGGDIKITSSFLDMIDTQLLTFTSGIGDAGNVKIVGDTIKFNDSQILTSTNDGAIGNAGKVTINATDSFNFENISQIFTDVETNAFGNAGEINITAPLLSITNNSQIATSSTGIGNAADVNITAQDISLDNSIIFARMDSPFLDFIAVGNSGNININTSLLKMSNDAQLNIRHNGIGNPGNININAEKISLDTSNINAGAFLENAGNVNIQAIDSVSLNKSSIYTSVLFGSGNGGNILIDAKSLLLANSSRIGGQSSDNILAGSAGNITVKTDDFVTLDNGSSISASAFTGTGGNVLIETGKFSVHNNSSIIAIVSGDQPAASLTINATESVEVSGGDSFLSIDTLGNGDAGELTINTGKLIVKDGGIISSSAASTPGADEEFSLLLPTGTGKAGNLEINARESVQIIGTTPDGFNISSLETNGGGGDGGKIDIKTPELIVRDGGQISAITLGIGNGGTIEIDAPLSVEVVGTHPTFNFLRSKVTTNSVDSLATGDAGNIKITTPKLIVSDRAEISALTTGGGKGGTIELNSKSISLNNGVQITARTLGEKKAGNIILNADNLEVTNNAQINTSTSSSGDAGDINIQVQNDITLTGENTGIFANTAENSTGNGGKIIIDPIMVTVKDGASIAVNSQGEGIGGDIELIAGTLNLDNGAIDAKTRSNTGGNIALKVDKILFMFHNSQISTTAGNEQFGGNGGNISINTPFIVAFPTDGAGNDITANAFTGNGGNVNINSQFLFGIESRNKTTSVNDITASSEFGQPGAININTPGIDPTRSLTNLPQGRVNAEVSQNCQASRGGTTAKLYNIGTGGIPHNPEALSNPEPFMNADLIPLQPAMRNIPERRENDSTISKSTVPTQTLPCQE